MNRREFLKSLVALGAILSVPQAALAGVSEQDIEHIWDDVLSHPEVFWVSGSGGALATSPGWDYPSTRAELYGIEIKGVTREGLLQLAGHEPMLEGRIDWLYECAIDEGTINEDSFPDLDSWILQSDEDSFDILVGNLVRWLYDEDLEPADYEYADLRGKSNRGEALAFFEAERDIADLFNIAIIYGDHPGSSYYAAELRMDVDDANALAIAHGLSLPRAVD